MRSRETRMLLNQILNMVVNQVFHYVSFIRKYIEVQLIYNVALTSSVRQSDSVIHTHVSVLFQILSPFWLLSAQCGGDFLQFSLFLHVHACLCVSPPFTFVVSNTLDQKP